MKEDKVVTGYGEHTDDGIVTEAKSIIKGCTGNASYTFLPTLLTDLATNLTLYQGNLVAAKNGGKNEVAAKDASKSDLAKSLHNITTEVNLQQKGNKNALLSSGAALTLDSNPNPGGEYAEPVTLSAKAGTATDELAFRVGTITGQPDHGVMFALTPALNASDDVTTWTMHYSSCHQLVVGGLIPATKYLVASAYQNLRGIKLVWSKPIIVWTKAG